MPGGKVKTNQNLPEEQHNPTTVNSVELSPEVNLSHEDEEKVTIVIDREMTDGGLITNGKLMVGEVTVPRYVARDLQRRQEEYFETKKKLLNKDVSVRMKSDAQKEALFLADPAVNENKKSFTRDYGLLGRTEWSYCSDAFKVQLLDMRKQMYGY